MREDKTMAEETLRDKLQELVIVLWRGGCMLPDVLREMEKRFVLHVLNYNRGNQVRAAREMGIHRNTLSRKIDELGLVRIKGQRNLWFAAASDIKKAATAVQPAEKVPTVTGAGRASA